MLTSNRRTIISLTVCLLKKESATHKLWQVKTHKVEALVKANLKKAIINYRLGCLSQFMYSKHSDLTMIRMKRR